MSDSEYWHRKWEENQIAFHEPDANPLLVQYFNALSLKHNSRIFLPLCGKSLDITWLLSKGYRVAGVELSAIAIEHLFSQLGVTPAIEKTGEVIYYRAQNIDIFVCDIFYLSRATLGTIDAVYDRAALVALPDAIRVRYTAHLTEITETAPQLLIVYEYDQRVFDGPPFSINSEDVGRHYKERYTATLLACRDVLAGLKGVCAAHEKVWLLKPI